MDLENKLEFKKDIFPSESLRKTHGATSERPSIFEKIAGGGGRFGRSHTAKM